MPRVSVLSDQGSSKHREDGFIVRHPFYGVADGMSANYCKEHPQKFYGEISGGEMAAREFEEVFFMCPQWPLYQCIRTANERIASRHVARGLSLESPGDLSGCFFAAAQFIDGRVDIMQVGDAVAFWILKGGAMGFTPNQMQKHEAVLGPQFGRMYQEVAQEFGVDLVSADRSAVGRVRAETWERYCALSRKQRGKNANSLTSPEAYGVMNGSPFFEGAVHHVSLERKDLRLLILCTDGMVSSEDMKRGFGEETVSTLCAQYLRGGLSGMLSYARQDESRKMNTSHVDGLTEVTAIAIEF